MALTKEQVKERLSDEEVIILNVLGEDEYRKLHITGSYNLPLRKDEEAFARAVERTYGKDKFFVTHCSGPGCDKGPSAARILRSRGFRADDYPGGMKDWWEAGYPSNGLLTREMSKKA